jgi:hypothetical protein
MIDKIYPKKLDSSLDLKLTPKDSMIDALNVSLTNSLSSGEEGSGNTGVIKNPLGNTPAEGFNSFDLPPVSNNSYQVIGSVTDIKTKVVYFFVYCNKLSEHGIYAYDPLGRLPKSKTVGTVKAGSVRLILKSNRLRFPQNGFVKADVVHVKRSELSKYHAVKSYAESKGYWDEVSADCIIYFTDNKNEPRKINVYRALLNNSQQENLVNSTGYSNYTPDEFEDFISACPRTPLDKIQFAFTQDPSFLGSNFSRSPGFTFAYQFVYEDGIESSISPYSDLAVPVVTLSQGADTSVDYSSNNLCELVIPPFNKEAAFIKIIAREHDTSSFLLIDEVSATASESRWNVGERKYRFYNDRVLTGVSDAEVAKQFDSVPKKAYTQAVTNNRLLYGNYVEGFDNVSVSATITPAYNKYPESQDLRIYVTPTVRSRGVHLPGMTNAQKAKRNSIYNGGSSFIIDVDASNLNLETGVIVKFQMTIAPDKNFHVFRKNGWAMPSNDSNSAQRYYNEGGIEQPYPITSDEGELFADVVNTKIVSGTTWTYTKSNGATETVLCKFGDSVTRPLILSGGPLTFGVEFTYTGTSMSGQVAADFVATVISYSITGRTLGAQYTNSISSLSATSTQVHSINLGLSGFAKIATNKTGVASNQLSYLVTPVFEDVSMNPTPKAPIGYFIVNKADVLFGLQYVSQPDGVNSVHEVLLNLRSVDGIEAFTCIRTPNNNGYWYVLTPSFMNAGTGSSRINAFLDNAQIPNVDTLDEFYRLRDGDVSTEIDSISGLPVTFSNFKKQFGLVNIISNKIASNQLKSNSFFEFTQDPNLALIGVCVIDGESGIGGTLLDSGPDPNFIEQNNQGSILSHIRLVVGQTIQLFGYFFTGSELIGSGVAKDSSNQIFTRVEVNNSLVVSGTYTAQNNIGIPTTTLSVIPLRRTIVSGYGPYKHPGQNDDTYNLEEYKSLRYPQIEILNLFTDLYSFEDYTDFRTFKSNSAHDFGVVYYDKRGRHGFVNPIGSLYIPGYSNQERSSGKGKVDVEIEFPPNSHPSWADSFRIVHSRSTSTESFIQYTAGGAFVRHTPPNEDLDNVYVSLNYLQSSVVSYVSSFGARSPEGGVSMYKFLPGDRVRVVSYAINANTFEYPYNLDFEIVDMVELGPTENPLHAGIDAAPYNKTGQFLVIKNNPFAPLFDYTSVKNGVDLWQKNCIVEIYRPSKIQDQSDKIFYEVSDTLRTTGSNQPIVIKNGDVWWRPVALALRRFNNGVFNDLLIDTEDSSLTNTSKPNFKSRYLESETCTDLIRGNNYGLGRPNVIYKQSKEIRNESGITYSLPTAQSAIRLLYSTFNSSLLNFKDLPEVYGAISYLIDRGDSLLCIQDTRCCLVPVNRNIISDLSGSELISASSQILGSERYFAVPAGCDGTPESIVEVDGTAYFVNKSLGAVFAVSSSQVEDLTSMGLESAIRDVIAAAVETARTEDKPLRIPGGYDQINKEYIFTVKNIDVVGEVDDSNTDDETAPTNPSRNR